MTTIYVDADACPVKNEVYKVARRLELKVFVVANAYLTVPESGRVELVVVPGDLDAADDWIAEHAETGDVVVTADIPLADRAVKRGARVLTPRGRELTEDSVCGALATRNLMESLRESGMVTSGPRPFEPKDRSRFLDRLDQTLRAIERDRRRSAAPGRSVDQRVEGDDR